MELPLVTLESVFRVTKEAIHLCPCALLWPQRLNEHLVKGQHIHPPV